MLITYRTFVSTIEEKLSKQKLNKELELQDVLPMFAIMDIILSTTLDTITTTSTTGATNTKLKKFAKSKRPSVKIKRRSVTWRICSVTSWNASKNTTIRKSQESTRREVRNPKRGAPRKRSTATATVTVTVTAVTAAAIVIVTGEDELLIWNKNIIN